MDAVSKESSSVRPPARSAEFVRLARQVTWAGIVVDILLAILKALLGSIAGSYALVADAVHSLSDLTTDFAIVFGVSYWSAPPDDQHPYGHGRIETLVTAAIGVTLACVAIGIAYNAVVGVRQDHTPQVGLVALAGAVTSILVKEILYRWTFRMGRHLNSSAIMANAWHHRSDAVSSVPVAIAAIVGLVNPAWGFVDHLGALVVSLFILHAAWSISRDAFFELADEGISAEVREEVRKIVLETAHVRAVHGVRGRRAGGGVHVDLHLLVDGELTVREGHEISEAVTRRLLTAGPSVLEAIVHLEPFDGRERVNETTSLWRGGPPP